MSLKKLTSLVMLLAMGVMTYTGLMLFISPPGRIANWADWRIVSLSKEEYAAVHTVFMVLFVVASILHIYFNWRPIVSYLRNSAKTLIVFTKEMVVASVLCVVMFFGTLADYAPFSTFLGFGEDVKGSWEEEYGEPPYNHAELSSLESFIKKMDFDKERSLQALKDANLRYESTTQTLKEIAKLNTSSPNTIYETMEKAQSKEIDMDAIIQSVESSEKYMGLGRKKVADVAAVVGLSETELIAKLKSIGIEASNDEKFKEVAEKAGMTPSDIIEKLGL